MSGDCLVRLGPAIEQSTKIITLSFFDSDGTTAVTPNSVTWTLRAADKTTVINSRTAVVVTPATSINIVLTGDDLAIGSNGRKRYVRVYGTYDSATYGNGLNYQQEYEFTLCDLGTLPN